MCSYLDFLDFSIHTFFVVLLLLLFSCFVFFFFFKQKTAYEMRISDWSSDVCSSDLRDADGERCAAPPTVGEPAEEPRPDGSHDEGEIGRASCRERVCQYV